MKATRRLVCIVLALWCASFSLAGTPASDRGIGGTGGPAVGPKIADRDIGGTGIVGVITRFGSGSCSAAIWMRKRDIQHEKVVAAVEYHQATRPICLACSTGSIVECLASNSVSTSSGSRIVLYASDSGVIRFEARSRCLDSTGEQV